MSLASEDKIMIWQSIPLMTAIDILILGIVGYAAAEFLRHGRRPARGSEFGFLAIFGGLLLVAPFMPAFRYSSLKRSVRGERGNPSQEVTFLPP